MNVVAVGIGSVAAAQEFAALVGGFPLGTCDPFALLLSTLKKKHVYVVLDVLFPSFPPSVFPALKLTILLC